MYQWIGLRENLQETHMEPAIFHREKNVSGEDVSLHQSSDIYHIHIMIQTDLYMFWIAII